MNRTSKPSHNDAESVTITPEMLDAHKPEVLRRLEDVGDNAVFVYKVDIDEDTKLLDCFDAAAGAFLGEELFEGAELRILADKAGSHIEWHVTGPECPTTIGRRYNLPKDTANAIRFLEDYLELGMRLPLTPVRLSDSVVFGPDGFGSTVRQCDLNTLPTSLWLSSKQILPAGPWGFSLMKM